MDLEWILKISGVFAWFLASSATLYPCLDRYEFSLLFDSNSPRNGF
jgi:hypothetical protein